MPSRPPLVSELKPTASGIIQDPQTGDRKVAPSKRPDGTLRKEIKIRPGFTPSEDVSKFRSARQQDFESRKIPKGSVIGMIRDPESATQAALRGMSEAQRKNLKRKEKRKASAAQSRENDLEAAPDDWDLSSSDNKPEENDDHDFNDEKNQKGSTNQNSTTTTTTTTTTINDSKKSSGQSKPITNPGNNLFQSAIKSSSSNPQIHPTQQLVPPQPSQSLSPSSLSPSQKSPNSNNSRKDVNDEKKRNGGVKMFGNALQSIEGISSNLNDKESIEKRAKAIRKKLTQAEQLKLRKDDGESLLPEQLEKISKIDELQTELSKLTL